MITESTSTATFWGGSLLNAFTVFMSTIFVDIIVAWFQWYLVALILIIGDLITGIIASLNNNEHIRFSRAGRRTLCKVMEYLCISLCGIVISTAFHIDWLKYAIFGLTYMFELSSMVGNYYRARHKVIRINTTDILNKWLGRKIGEDIKVEIEDTKGEKDDEKEEESEDEKKGEKQ